MIEARDNHQEQEMIEDLEEMITQLNQPNRGDHEKAHDLLQMITAVLLDLGVGSVELEYADCADDGAIESAAFFPESIEVPPELQRLVEHWACTVLPAGWEDNDGGQGTVKIDVVNAIAEIEHAQNYVTSELSTYTIG